MACDTLQQTLSVGPLAAGEQVIIPHALVGGGFRLLPTLILPDTPTPIGVVSADRDGVTFKNTGLATLMSTFLVQHTHSVQESSPLALLYWRGGVAGDVVFPNPTFTSENKDSVALVPGQVVAVHPSGTGVVRAVASSSALLPVGLVVLDLPVGFSGPVQASGPMTLPDWSAVTGTVSLAVGATYYLAAALGQIAVAPPLTGFSQVIGRQVDLQTLIFAPLQGIRL